MCRRPKKGQKKSNLEYLIEKENLYNAPSQTQM